MLSIHINRAWQGVLSLLILALISLGLGLGGCVTEKNLGNTASSTNINHLGTNIFQPQLVLVGKVVYFNRVNGSAILSFPVGIMPRKDQVMTVFRQGRPVGEIRITGPQMDYRIAGDLTTGEASEGDEVTD